MSAQLEILVIDRLTGTIRNTIMAMQFEGCSKDDLNYHMLVNSRPAQRSKAPGEDGAVDHKAEVNQLILLYPNGILCIYDNILQQGSGQGRKKVRLSDMIQADYESILAP